MKTLPKERRYETLSYLPPLTDQQVAKQIENMLDQEFIPGVKFEENPDSTTYFWTMWKLPLLSSPSAQKILVEVRKYRCKYPNGYIRVIGFDIVGY
ncbi:MAG: ribulose bisphosphate carboxylase small subunit [cyanobacterium endosymbiont of Rhopalodia musculus]|uniref:ribulose bisphosphate carboxylase small subunit n=1 Tax=cyanobacterium endosymbiont of Epithemia clementina EcSB TaxID=3034674 RepID=UPI00247FB932|nr:ribulose bisphosphate carboxylase small subunit [cyanobacterium endosymbiont of Epithemia clementina EcSB]WGT67208.1 ribulose bisphosphate carboxylase small subunit [cyanobacterium endosymbiont of Epithemia clementina EcSB]